MIASVILVGIALALGACSQSAGRPCYPGDYVACTCVDGKTGFSKCDGTGSGYGACDCTGDIGVGLDAAADASNFLVACDPANDQCGPGLMCFSFNAKGPHCSKGCSTDSDCPPPSPGCSLMKVCKLS